MRTIEYDRRSAVEYAIRWALKRNPKYYDFSRIGGDCTNFASQCLYAGSKIMNYTPIIGWYYISANDRTASWTGVEYFYNFITKNENLGPFGEQADRSEITIGDFVQIKGSKDLYTHTLVISGVTKNEIYVSAHSSDSLMRPLSSYESIDLRFIHVKGVRIT